MRYVEVAVDAPTGPGRTFSYAVPDGMDLRAGHLVEAPFGARRVQGIVFALADAPQVAETKDVGAVVFEDAPLDDTRLRLAEWISEYYICSLFEAAAAMLPAGGRARARTLLTLADDVAPDAADAADAANIEGLTPFQQRVAGYIARRGVAGAQQDRLIKALGDGALASVNSLVRRGIARREYSLRGPSVRHRYRAQISIAADRRAEVDAWLRDGKQRAPKRRGLLERLLEGGGAAMDGTAARKEYGGAVRALLNKGWLAEEAVAVERDPLDGREFSRKPPPRLTERQAQIAAALRAGLSEPAAPRTFVIQGVTGSGKTEVYLDAAQHCVESGRRVIALVPEIALTYQTIERFAARFEGRVAVLHSGLSDGERFDQWWKIRRGDYDIVIGSRSAIFAPLPDVGLIVIDEEHEWTYKQHDAAPRYHARDVALRLAELTGAVVALGSASPDVATYYGGLRRRHSLHLLTERFVDGEGDGGAADGRRRELPSVSVVDMRAELREGNSDMFSRELTNALDECLAAGNQAMLFLNRRGTASYLQCFGCGYSLRCRRCDVNVTYHAKEERFICHYCGARRRPQRMCPRCLNYRMRYYGIGTEAVADEVARRYPDAGVLRWDRDIAGSPKAHESLLRRFRSGEARVLVGTQMIAKGLHFPQVTLVGVVSADVGLSIPDYRAGERAFQLLYQVAGRAGRGRDEGRAIVQTFQPDNYAIQAAAAQDYQAFYTREMAHRREQGNPPHARLIRLLRTHTNQAQCEADAISLAARLRERQLEWGYADVEVLGPVPAYPMRLRGRYRWHIILRGQTPRALLDGADMPRGWVVDVDPVALT